MIRLILKRLVLGVLTLWLVATLVFLVSGALPGDAAASLLGQDATPATLAALRAQMGLDQPEFIRYWTWLGGILHGNFGISLANGQPVAQVIATRLPNSLMLAGLSALVAIPVSLVLGIASAMKPNSVFDRLTTLLSIIALSTPSFLIATLFVLVLSVWTGWFPALSSVDRVHSLGGLFQVMTLPVLALSLSVIGQMARMTRAILLQQMNEPYVETAVLKGSSGLRAAVLHALPNVAGPIVNASALSLNALISGVVFVEVIFAYPGLTKLMVDSVSNRDLPLMQACALIFCAGFLILVLIADIIAILTNPKLRTA
ncbi:ABC transporter permease [Pseudooceanicola sp. CBS1P-1]|uniref:ABC transporter permease subunit n=1 Tax=Pseudooceanicola albus TaxID=2692189 RepID=A0A6L7G5X2_9RHOB|nr:MULTISPECIES: ABC transporter permease [Pseudooceanicola]MBT9386132.1 ABC transporter permease [Pseudooceanicola endophyticus]MXN19451.1 ABC transporter permease subunit [Pseudooceanicola albus]